MSGQQRQYTSLLIVGLGTSLLAVAIAQHVTEITELGSPAGPLAALVVDGLPALGVIYAGIWVFRSDLVPEDQRVVVFWCFIGCLFAAAIIGATVLIRVAEGRRVSEPLFPFLATAGIGAVAGVVAGYYHARARADAREAQTVSNALAFVNDLIRHDLRNDLNVIAGHADMLDPADDEPTIGSRSSSTVISEKATEALTRIETSEAVTNVLIGETALEAIELVAIVSQEVEQLETAYDVTVETDCPGTAYVAANEGVRSVVDNLLENAVEHNDDDPRITVTVETTDATVRLLVSDNGPGMSAAQKESVRAVEGSTDSGLNLVQSLIEIYGGEFAITDNEPRGTRFTVTLPRIESPPDDETARH